MDENIRLKLQKAMQQNKKSLPKDPPTTNTTLTQASELLSYEKSLENLQKDLEQLESTLNEHLKKKAELQQTQELEPKKKVTTKKELKELEKQITEDEIHFKDKQQELYVLQQSITYFNEGKKYSPSDWEIDPHEMEPIHRAFINSMQKIGGKLPENYAGKSNLLYQCTKYLEAISIASNINLNMSQNIQDEVIQGRLDNLYHDYVKIIIIASGKEQPAYAELIKEYSQKLPINSLTYDDFVNESYALLMAYHSIGNKIVGEMALLENEVEQILSLFITNLLEEKYTQLQQNEEKEHAEIDPTKLYAEVKIINQALSSIIALSNTQAQNIASLQSEINNFVTENQDYAKLQMMLNNILEQSNSYRAQIESFNNPNAEINNDIILSLIENIESLYVFPTEMLILLDEFETNHSIKNSIYDINLIATVYQTLYKLIPYNMVNHIKHVIVDLTLKLSTAPTQLADIKAIDMLKNVDLSNLISNVITPLLTQDELRKEIWQLQENYNLSTSYHKLNMTLDKLQQLEKNLPEYQQIFLQSSVFRKNILANPYSLIDLKEMYTLIKNNQNIGNDFYMLQQLKVMLDNIDKETISDKNQFGIKKIHKSLNKETNLFQLIIQIFHSTENKLLLSKSIVALEIAQGDMFHEDKKEQLEDVLYTLKHEVSPITLISFIKHFYSEYDPEQCLSCLSFIKRYLEIDQDNSLVYINFKDSQFIKDLIEFNQNIIVNNQEESELTQKAQEINELLMSKILEKENVFNQNLNDISQGKFPASILARRLKSIYLEISHNRSNIALIKDLVTEVETIAQAPHLLSNKEARVEITTTFNHLCHYLTDMGLFEEAVNNISNRLQHQLETSKESKPEKTTPLPIEKYVLDDILNRIAQSKIEPTQYEALLDEFIDNIESGYRKYFCDITYPELMYYVLDNDASKVAKGLLPKAEHVRNYMMYNQLVKDYCQIMVFYDHKT